MIQKNRVYQYVDHPYCVYVGFSYDEEYQYEGKVFCNDEFIMTVHADSPNDCADKGFAYAKSLNDEPTNFTKEMI